MAVELPDLVITSRTQSQETIDKILKEQGYEVTHLHEDTDEPDAAAATAVEPPAVPEVLAPPDDPPAAPVEAAPIPDAPAKPKPGSAKYKEQRDEARADRDRLLLEQARKDGELTELRRQLAERSAGPAVEAPKVEPPKPPDPEPEKLPERPKLATTKAPKLEDPGIDGDWDKFQEANEVWQAATLKANEEYAEKLYDWKEDVKQAKQRGEQERIDREASQVRATVEAEQRSFMEKFDAALAEGKTRWPDFEEATKKDHGKFIKSRMMDSVLVDMDKGDAADILHWLATHPEEAHALTLETMLPSKDGKVIDTEAERAKVARRTLIGFGKIMATADFRPAGSIEPDTDAEDVPPPPEPPPTPVVAETPPVPATPPAAPTAGLRAGALPPVKPQPSSPVGGRGATVQKRLKDMSQKELALIHPDEFRRRMDAGEMN